MFPGFFELVLVGLNLVLMLLLKYVLPFVLTSFIVGYLVELVFGEAVKPGFSELIQLFKDEELLGDVFMTGLLITFLACISMLLLSLLGLGIVATKEMYG